MNEQLFTGQPRSSTVTATTDAVGVTLGKLNVEMLMMRNAGMYVKVLKNIVDILSDRRAQANTQNEQHPKMIMRLRDQMERLASG